MNIQEAVKLAMETDGVICRESVHKEYVDCFHVIKPTDCRCICQEILIRRGIARQPWKAWSPTANDLVASDWKVLEDKF